MAEMERPYAGEKRFLLVVSLVVGLVTWYNTAFTPMRGLDSRQESQGRTSGSLQLDPTMNEDIRIANMHAGDQRQVSDEASTPLTSQDTTTQSTDDTTTQSAVDTTTQSAVAEIHQNKAQSLYPATQEPHWTFHPWKGLGMGLLAMFLYPLLGTIVVRVALVMRRVAHFGRIEPWHVGDQVLYAALAPLVLVWAIVIYPTMFIINLLHDR
ncbi:MAG: hypothetical protein ACR2M1_08385 [Gemmatimonadaceae bacterium]